MKRKIYQLSLICVSWIIREITLPIRKKYLNIHPEDKYRLGVVRIRDTNIEGIVIERGIIESKVILVDGDMYKIVSTALEYYPY